MVRVGGVAGQAEGTRRGERGHRRRLMTLIAARVRIHRSGVGLDDPRGAVASRAVAPGAVMIGVTVEAGFHLGARLQRYRDSVTLDALHFLVLRVNEVHFSRPGPLPGHRYLDGDLLR